MGSVQDRADYIDDLKKQIGNLESRFKTRGALYTAAVKTRDRAINHVRAMTKALDKGRIQRVKNERGDGYKIIVTFDEKDWVEVIKFRKTS